MAFKEKIDEIKISETLLQFSTKMFGVQILVYFGSCLICLFPSSKYEISNNWVT